MESPQNRDHTLLLSRYRSLSVIKTDHTLVAKITNTSIGQAMSVSQTAVKKFIAAMSLCMERRENLLTETNKDALATDSTLITHKKPVKRKLTFDYSDSPHMFSNSDSSPIIIDDSWENSPCSHDNKDHEQLQNSHTGSDCTDSAYSPIPTSQIPPPLPLYTAFYDEMSQFSDIDDELEEMTI